MAEKNVDFELHMLGNPATIPNVDPVARSSMQALHPCIYHILETQADRTPDATAIVAPGRAPLTYSRLRSQVAYTVKTLNSVGIGHNDRVAMALPDGPEAATAFLGVAAGATCAPLNPYYRTSEFDFYLTDLNAKAVIAQSGIDSPVLAAAQKYGIPVIELLPVLEAEAGVFTLVAKEQSQPFREGFAEVEDLAFVLYTSGTTSRSKVVPLTQANIYASARNVQAALELSCNDRYLNVSPLFYSQGIMLTIASMFSGASVVCTPGFSATHFFEWLEEFHPTWYSAAPTIHQAILAHSRSNRRNITPYPLRLIRSAAAPLAPHVMAELEKSFRSPVIEGYGMTECYPITSNPLPPRKRKAGSAGVAAGTEIAIIDEAGNLLPGGQTGEIVVSGPHVMRGYLNDPTNNKSTFANGWFRTGDQGYLDPDGYLCVTGRLKEIINRGGEKISPREVDEVLLEHSAVSEAITFPVPHVTLGEDVAAAVVLRDKASVTGGEIQTFAAMRLAEFKVPRRILIVKEIPKSATGKVQRIGLADKLGLTTPNPAARGTTKRRRAPQGSVEKKLARIWIQVLGLATVGLHDNFFDLGGNSLLAVHLIGQVERAFGKHLPLPALFQAPTVEQLASVLRQEKWPDSWASLVPIQPGGSKSPFFWIHGDSSSAFLPRYLGPDQPLYGLQHQSQDGKPALYTQVETIAAHYLKEMLTVQPKGPYFLGGYSFGGTVAFEVAQQLRRQGEEVAVLALLDSRFPGGDIEDITTSRNVLTNMTLFRDEAHRHLRNLALLESQEKLAYVLVRVKEKIKSRTATIRNILKRIRCKVYLALGRPIPLSLRSLYILDIYDQARRNYVPQIYPGRAIYFKSEERPSDHRLNWGRLIADGLEVYEVPGNHLDLRQETHIQFWAEPLKTCLHKAQSKETSDRSDRS